LGFRGWGLGLRVWELPPPEGAESALQNATLQKVANFENVDQLVSDTPVGDKL